MTKTAKKIVRFQPGEAPAPGTRFMRLTAAEVALLSDLRRLDRIVPAPGWSHWTAELAKVALRVLKQQGRRGAKNIDKPVMRGHLTQRASVTPA